MKIPHTPWTRRLIPWRWVESGDRAPAWFGLVAKTLWDQQALVCVVPFNLIARPIWLLWCWVQAPWFDTMHERHSEIKGCHSRWGWSHPPNIFGLSRVDARPGTAIVVRVRGDVPKRDLAALQKYITSKIGEVPVIVVDERLDIMTRRREEIDGHNRAWPESNA